MSEIKELIFTKQAEEDFRGIYDFIKRNDSVKSAKRIYYLIKENCNKIKCFPHIGHIPTELEKVSIFHYLEINFKPYRIIYQVMANDVIIFGIFDGHRNLEDILTKRLLK